MTNQSWTDIAIQNKLEALRQFCLEPEKPAFFPENLMQFCEWEDELQGFRGFTRPVLYKSETQNLRKEAQRLIQVATQRWSAKSSERGTRISELESLTKLLASRYHQERHRRLDLERSASSLRASVDSLSSKLREVLGARQVRLVESTITLSEPP